MRIYVIMILMAITNTVPGDLLLPLIGSRKNCGSRVSTYLAIYRRKPDRMGWGHIYV